MRYLILTVAGFGDYEGVELAAVRLDADTLAWLRSLLARPWPAGVRTARLVDFPEAVAFVNPPADDDAADQLMERLADDEWAVIDEAERASLRPLDGGVDHPDVVVWLDGEGAATGVGFVAGIEFRSVYLEGTTRTDVTPHLLSQMEATDAPAAGVSPC